MNYSERAFRVNIIESGVTVPLARLITVYACYVDSKTCTAERFPDAVYSIYGIVRKINVQYRYCISTST